MNLSPHNPPSDRRQRMESLVALFLRMGVIACSFLLTLGFLVSVVDKTLGYQLLNGGIAALIALPICRVALCFVLLLRNRDWFFVATTGFVLLLLVLGVVMGKDL